MVAGGKLSLFILLCSGWPALALNDLCPQKIADEIGLAKFDDSTWRHVLSVGFSHEREADDLAKWKKIEDRLNGSLGGPTSNGQLFEFALASSLPEQERKKLLTAFDNKPRDGRFLVYRPSKPFVWSQADSSKKGSLLELGHTFLYDDRGRSLLYNLKTDTIDSEGAKQSIAVPLRFDDRRCGLDPEWKNFCEAFVSQDYALDGIRNFGRGNSKRDAEVFKSAIELQDKNCRKLSGVYLWESNGDSTAEGRRASGAAGLGNTIIKATTALKDGLDLEAFRKFSSGRLKCQCQSNGQLVGEIGSGKTSCEKGVEHPSRNLEMATRLLGLGTKFLVTFRKVPAKSELGHLCWSQIQRASSRPLDHRDSLPTAQ